MSLIINFSTLGYIVFGSMVAGSGITLWVIRKLKKREERKDVDG